MEKTQKIEDAVQISDETIVTFWNEFAKWSLIHSKDTVREKVDSCNLLVEEYFSDIALEMIGDDGDNELGLVITAHGIQEKFPLAIRIFQLMPQMPQYKARLFRERTLDGEFGINMDGFTLKSEEILVIPMIDDGLVGLQVCFAKEIPFDRIDHAKHMTHIMMDHVLGEYDFAIKVGYVEFVQSDEFETKESIQLSRFAKDFDHMWINKLGHNGQYPVSDNNWSMLTLNFPEDDDGPAVTGILTFHNGANTLVGRADMTMVVGVDLPAFENSMIEKARDFQSKFADLIARDQSGIVAYMMVREGWRVALYYVTDVAKAKAMMDDEIKRAGFEQYEVFEEFDPSWSKYRRYSSHLFENTN
jgi:hypothetical protein